ncbi:MAG TPA: serine hydrolase [Vicinamibacteria bacterium]|nr:serine hydrolase [Vicinamibacteria bacterium]
MRLSTRSLGLFAFLVLTPAALPAADLSLAAKVRDFDAYATKGVADWKVPGLAVAVVKDGQVAFVKAYGVRELGQAAPTTPRTLFAIGSTTKAMTAAGLAMLVDEGKLRWDDPVIRHLPGFVLSDPYLTREVTVRDLLTHRAGMPNADFLWYRTQARTADILKGFALVKPETSMRSHFTYQNVMYQVAGEVLAAASGMPWADVLRQRIFAPLGMTDTSPTHASIPAGADVASPHDEVAEKVQVIQNAPVDNVPAAGAVWSSASDMARWVAFLLNGGSVGEKKLLSAASLQELFTPQTIVGVDGFYPTARLTKPHFTTYGLGWFQQDYDGRAVSFHTGSIDGMVAICGLLRDEKVGVVVLANRDHAELRHALMLRAFDVFGGGGAKRDWSTELLKLYADLRAEGKAKQAKLEEGRVAGTRPTLPLAAYAGTYADPLFGEVTVKEDGAGLRLAQGPELRARLEHWNYDTWKVVWDMEWVTPTFLRFALGAQGGASGLQIGGLDEPDDAQAHFHRREAKN